MSYSDVKEVARDLTKLALNGSPYWRLAVTGCVMALSATALWGHYNYARAEEVDQKIESAVDPIRVDLTSIKIERLTDSILSAKRDQCDAVREGRAAQAWTKRIQELSSQYFKMVGRPFEMPTCGEV